MLRGGKRNIITSIGYIEVHMAGLSVKATFSNTVLLEFKIILFCPDQVLAKRIASDMSSTAGPTIGL